MKCLLIDDDLDDQDIFSIALKDLDPSVEIFFAQDGIEALNLLKSDKNITPDYIFLDMNMPRMNGEETLLELKMIKALNEVPVFMYSTFSETSRIQEILDLGAADFIIKPNNIEDINKILYKIIFKQN
ncbi:MAG TPA: response regulator [Saprospiraceae bacterium]|nr:response regulator [Saprospiraceae bacterium]